MFAGLRPLVKARGKSTAALSRNHLISESASGMITITGGKWTTSRKMAEDVIGFAVKQKSMLQKECVTKGLMLAGHDKKPPVADVSGASGEELKKLIQHSVKEEMCMTPEDFLSRRTRQLLLDANVAIEKVQLVTRLMAKEMDKDEDWITEQINNFNSLAKNYLPN
jgi:glycerol-3-phosphate dehydrogenase